MSKKSSVLKNICDLSRKERTGIPEVVLAMDKDDDSLLDAVEQILMSESKVLATKCTEQQLELLRKKFSKKVRVADELSGTAVISNKNYWRGTAIGKVAVIAAGTSDLFVAEEATISAEFFGLEVRRYYDCGVAGLHRLETPMKEIVEKGTDVLIVVAGMDGALPSVVSGLTDVPLIAVPTSVGYGTGTDGISALLTMLNSCSPGFAVVNIDNGFGAAACAYKIVRAKDRCKSSTMRC